MWGNAPPIRIKIAKSGRDTQGIIYIKIYMCVCVDMVMDMEPVA